MTLTKEISDKELMVKGADILFKELGSVDAIRFLSMPRPAREESLERHKKWQRSLDKKYFYDQVFNNYDE